jgi:hypothetical protein
VIKDIVIVDGNSVSKGARACSLIGSRKKEEEGGGGKKRGRGGGED